MKTIADCVRELAEELTLPEDFDRRGMYMPVFIPCSPDDISYTVAEDGSSITFRPCGIVSHNPEDIRQRYCAACHRWMDILEVAREIRREMGMMPK